MYHPLLIYFFHLKGTFLKVVKRQNLATIDATKIEKYNDLPEFSCPLFWPSDWCDPIMMSTVRRIVGSISQVSNNFQLHATF